MRKTDVFATAPAIALLLNCCSAKELSAEEKLIAEAKAAVAATLKDPDSAKFRLVEAYPEKKLVCGEVNGKNSYGAYSGFSPFFSNRGFAQVADPEGIFWERYKELCVSPSWDDGLAEAVKEQREAEAAK